MRNAIVVFLAVILMSGCIDIDITSLSIEEEMVTDTMPVITFSPAAKPTMWVHPGEYQVNTMSFVAPVGYPVDFDIKSSDESVAVVTSFGHAAYTDPDCITDCKTWVVVYEFYVYGRQNGQARISYSLKIDPRVKGSFMVKVDPRG